MTVVAVDAMFPGGIHTAAVEGAARASLGRDMEVVLVGDVGRVAERLNRLSYEAEFLSVMPSSPDPLVPTLYPEAELAANPYSSLLVGLNELAGGGVDAFVTAAPRRLVAAACERVLRRVPGCPAAALTEVLPAVTRPTTSDPFLLLLDAGVVHAPTADAYVGFALMGRAYSRIISRLGDPRVGLFSPSADPFLIEPAEREAHEQMAVRFGEAYVGLVSPADLTRAPCDVIVTDAGEGRLLAEVMYSLPALVRAAGAYAAHDAKRADRLARKLDEHLADLTDVCDFRAYGGAPILGYDRNLIRIKPQSPPAAVHNAVRLAARCVKREMPAVIEVGLMAPLAPDTAAGDA